ncbi:MAG TPA: adenosylcobalamin-dependent ribonucleoside-diphosphate reductase [Firmicutes bacterium]|nr:adenosylcobalamin-dependent ribonucleoside-diphosphate reductase [Bacillota bacterium]
MKKVKLTANALTVLEKRYLKKDKSGKPVEKPEEMFMRVARNIALMDILYAPEVYSIAGNAELRDGTVVDEPLEIPIGELSGAFEPFTQNDIHTLRMAYKNKAAYGLMKKPFSEVLALVKARKKELLDLVESFYAIMADMDFLPNSPALMNAGRELQQLSACFVLPIEDSMVSIFDTLKHAALIHQSGGGTGFSFSRLRPKSDVVRSTGGIASGPVSFMKVYNAATEAVKQGGCVVPETLVTTNRGIVPIRELGPEDAPADTWHRHAQPLVVATDDGPQTSDEFYNHGVSPIRRIRTKHGYHLAATPEHRIRVIDEEGHYVWRHLRDLEPGDWVVLQKGHLLEPEDYSLPGVSEEPHFNAKEVHLPAEASEELGEFLGYLVGHNCVGTTDHLIFTVCDEQPEVAEWLLRVSGELFSITPVANKKEKDGSTNYFFNSTILVNWLQQLGVGKTPAKEARIPRIIFRKGVKMARGFLRGMFTADGTVSEEGYPVLCSVSEALIDDVQQLLLAVGIPSSVTLATDRAGALGNNPVFRLRVITRAGLELFAHTIGFIDGERNALLARALDRAVKLDDVIPDQEEVMASVYTGPGRGCGSMRGVSTPHHMARSRLAALAEKHKETRNSHLAWFLSNDQFYDQIESIEEGESLTLDLSVPANNTYIANGFVSHNTRRGANMGILRVDHPDIIEFIKCKEDDREVTNFNISVAVTDAFMKAVADGAEYELINPRNGEVTGRLNAKTVFDLIVEHAWRNGEPGVIFIDRINKYNPTPQAGQIESTNPCVTADTWITTGDGPRQVRQLVGRPFKAVVNGQLYEARAEGFFKTGTKPVVKLRTREGHTLRLTTDHLVLRVGDSARCRLVKEWVPVAELKPGDRIVLHNHRSFSGWPGELNEGEGYLLGLLVGDGMLKEDAAQRQAVPDESPSVDGIAPVMRAALEYTMAMPHRAGFSGWIPVGGRQEYRLKLASERLAERMGMRPGKKTVTPEIERASSDGYRGFLRGLFDCDGSVQGTPEKGVSIRLAQSDLELLQTVQRMLLRLGICSTIYENRRMAAKRSMPDGKDGYAQHELVITGDNLAVFAERIGFAHAEKARMLELALNRYRRRLNREQFFATVAFIQDDGVEDVYDVRVPGINAFDANGLYVHNCGEQPLLPYEACCLASVNLSNMVKEGETPGIDWQRLEHVVRSAIHFLDNLIDANRYPLPEIQSMVNKTRKVGLGVMGWADMLIKLRVPYNSEEAVKLAEEVMSFIQEKSMDASEELAEHRGVFPLYSGSVYDVPGGRKMRNATTTTIAPTGTISIIAGTSSGIEPIFSIAFTRNVLDKKSLIEINPLFQKVARERGFYTDELMEKIARTGSLEGVQEVPEEVRRVFVTAHDISPEWHVRMQAAFQKYTHNAVSKTVNFPNSATKEDVATVYRLAYELGCKGVTVYRDGSREEQVLTKGAPAKVSEQSGEGKPVNGQWGKIKPIARPKRLQGFTDVKETPLGKLFLTLNLLDGHPIEMFAQIGKAGSDVTAFTEGIARLISLALRSGIDPAEVADQLLGIGGSRSVGYGPNRVRSVPDAMGQFLSEYLNRNSQNGQAGQPPRGEAAPPPSIKSFSICPVCGLYSLAHVEGCLKCYACGYSEC